MIKQKETRRFAEYIDNNLDALLPEAMALWTQHHNLLLKSLKTDLSPEEYRQMNALAQYRIQAEQALLPYLLQEKSTYTIYDIENLIQKNRWMPHLAEKRFKENDVFFSYPLTDQIRSVLLFATTQIDAHKMDQIISTPALSEQSVDPNKTVRFVRNFNSRSGY